MDRQPQCCIAGGGPAGMMLDVLLAHANIDVCVLEKHSDFLRDFRGDTIHPSTLAVMDELGWLDDFLELPHDQVKELSAYFGDEAIKVADFSTLDLPANFIAMTPQWHFLNFLAEKGKQYPSFTMLMDTEAKDLVHDNGKVCGVRAEDDEGELTIAADLVVAADGRSSTLRAASGLDIQPLGAPMDVLWFRLPRNSDDTSETQGRFQPGGIFIMLNRGEYWQCAFVIPKDSIENIRAGGIEAFRHGVGRMLPFEADRASAISTWGDVKLLTVAVDRMTEWAKPGLLCIGDAAHAMSPVGGVGVNLAIQDAVAAANILHAPLREGTVSFDDLQKVQKRRFFPTRVTQRLQLSVQDQLIRPTLNARGDFKPPLALRLIKRFPYLRRFPARLVGVGVRPEHVSEDLC